MRCGTISRTANASGAPAVVLLDETEMKLDARGNAVVQLRFALRIAHLSGRKFAAARISYLEKQDRVNFARAWVVRNGAVNKFKSTGEWADISETQSTSVFGEFRAKVISAEELTVKDDVFAYEAEVQQSMLVAQYFRRWGGKLPVVTESLKISIPSGFALEVVHERAQPEEIVSPDQRSRTWVLRNSPYFPDEPFATPATRLYGETFVQIAPLKSADDYTPAVFRKWSDVYRWAEGLSAGQCDSDASLESKVRELTQGAEDNLSKIKSLARYVQTLRYVAMDRDLGKGFGYRPRRASQVFAQGYGDCKDKTNLLRSMLHLVGIESYVAIAYQGGDHVPIESFPSPRQFNHAISAIVVDESVTSPAVVTGSGGERLLLFDSTHPHVLLGDLPEALQGSKVFVLSPRSESLLPVPRLDPESSHLTRRHVSMEVGLDGSLSGYAEIKGLGSAAIIWRSLSYQVADPQQFQDAVATTLGDALRGATLTETKAIEESAPDFHGIRYNFSVRNFLQFLPGNIAVAKLEALSRRGVPTFSSKDRIRPIQLESGAFDDVVGLALPKGVGVEELPAAATVETEYGSYRRTVHVADGRVVLERKLTIRGQEVAATHYAKVRKFFADVSKADRATLLLRLPNP